MFRDYSKDVDLLDLSQDIKDVFKYIPMWVSSRLIWISIGRYSYSRVHQVLPSKGQNRVSVTTVHTGLFAGRRRRRRVYQSDRARPFDTDRTRSGVLGRAVSEPERSVSAELAAPRVVFVVVQVAGKYYENNYNYVRNFNCTRTRMTRIHVLWNWSIFRFVIPIYISYTLFFNVYRYDHNFFYFRQTFGWYLFCWPQ